MRTATLMILFMLLSPSMLLAEPPCSPPVLSAVTIQEETLGFDVDVEYPVLCCPQATHAIRNWVGFLIFDFKKLDPGHDLTDFPHKYSLKGRYAVWPARDRLVSVKLDISVYTGGAHGNHWPMTWVFDIQGDHCLFIEDLFSDLETALPEVSDLVREPLISSLGPMYVPDMLAQGIEPMDRNFNRFILTEEGVAFFFAPYQVAPFAAGEQVVTIPYQHLAHLLDPEIRMMLNLAAPVAPESNSR